MKSVAPKNIRYILKAPMTKAFPITHRPSSSTPNHIFFISYLISERKAGEVFAGNYAASLSTSIRFFDQTAHAYIHAISDVLVMKFLGSYSAEMYDLLETWRAGTA